MRSRTRSASLRMSRPSTVAWPPLSGSKPVSILITVVLPLPLGPRKPKISPLATWKLTPLTAVNFPKLRTRPSARMAGSLPLVGFGGAGVTGLPSVSELDVGGHARQHPVRGVVDADLHADHLVHALLAG